MFHVTPRSVYMEIKMKTFMLLFLFCALTSMTFGQHCGINTAGVLIQQLTNVSMTIAEGLFYDTDSDKLYFVDRMNPHLCVIDGKTAQFYCIPIPDVKYIAAVIPIKNEKNKMVGLADNKYIFLTLQRDSKGHIVQITIEDIVVVEENSDYSIAASIVDKKGRLWIDCEEGKDRNGKVLQIHKDNSIKEVIKDGSPMGMGFSPDNTIFYIVDSSKNLVYKYDFDVNSGTIRKPTVIYNLTAEIYLEGYICSLKVAKDNTLWLGICKSGILINYNWKKKYYKHAHNFPALYPNYLEIGGPKMDILFVGTNNMRGEEKTPAAGAVFAISGTGTKGIPSYKASMPEIKKY